MNIESIMKDKEFNEIYNSERDKLSRLPDADADFVALDKALNKYHECTNY